MLLNGFQYLNTEPVLSRLYEIVLEISNFQLILGFSILLRVYQWGSLMLPPYATIFFSFIISFHNMFRPI
jgi:hypothetical protein